MRIMRKGRKEKKWKLLCHERKKGEKKKEKREGEFFFLRGNLIADVRFA